MHISRKTPEPELRSVSFVSPRILALTVKEGWIEGGIQIPYVPEEGETLEKDTRVPYLVWIVKNGERVGIKVEDPRFGAKRFPLEEVKGDKLVINEPVQESADKVIEKPYEYTRVK